MLKYGKLALVDGLSGSSGQTAPPRGSTIERALRRSRSRPRSRPVTTTEGAAGRSRRRAAAGRVGLPRATR